MKEQSDLISIIIPVYNVVDYLDRCIESIVRQPCDNIEIILVNDGSTDGSYDKCLKWQGREKKIRVISQENKGLGPARLAGIEAASGEFLAFVDSDDWVHKDFITSITEAIHNNKVDIIYFDIYEVYEQKTEVKKLRIEEIKFNCLSDVPFSAVDIPEVVYQSGNWTWNKIYRKSLWQRLQIKQPAHTVEDICTIFILLIKAEKIYHLRKKLYYYFQRPNSLTYKDSFIDEYQKAVDIAEENFVFYHIDEKFRYYIGKILGECISFTKLNFRNRDGVEQRIINMENKFRNSLFSIGSIGEISAIVFGSFNLRMIVKEVMYYLPPYYGFSSIISMMNPPNCIFPISKKVNNLRLASLNAEFMGLVKKMLKQGSTDYVFLDLMEDRYDVIKLPCGGYLTKSEAFEEAGVMIPQDSIVIKYGSEEFISLWKKQCLTLIRLLQITIKPERVVLIRHRLSQFYGVNGGDKVFKDEKIHKSNEIIAQLEKYLIQNFEGITILDSGSTELYYTDSKFTFGCYPWHLNVKYYSDMGRRLRNILENGGMTSD